MILWCSLLFPGGWGQISPKMVKNQLLASLFKGLRINLFVNAYGKTKWIEQKWRSPKRWIFLRITASSGGKLVFKNTHFFNKGPLLGKFNPICRHLFHPGRMDHEKSKFDYNWIKCIWGFILPQFYMALNQGSETQKLMLLLFFYCTLRFERLSTLFFWFSSSIH